MSSAEQDVLRAAVEWRSQLDALEVRLSARMLKLEQHLGVESSPWSAHRGGATHRPTPEEPRAPLPPHGQAPAATDAVHEGAKEQRMVRLMVDEGLGAMRQEVQAKLHAMREEMEARLSEELSSRRGSAREWLGAVGEEKQASAAQEDAPSLNGYKPLLATSGHAPHPGREPEELLQARSSPESCGEPEELPASLYNYCVESLTFSARPHAEKAWLYMLLVTDMQNGLLMTLLQMNKNNLMDFYTAGNPHEPYSFKTGCYRENGKLLIGGDSICRSIMGLLSCAVVCILVNGDIHNQARASLPDPGAPGWLRVCMTMFWFLQAVLLPSTAIMEIGRLFALSKSPMDIVLNTLAATFIVELDELLFEGVLTTEQKAEYFALPKRRKPFSDVHTSSEYALGWMRFAGMLWQYFYIRNAGFAHDGYQDVTNEILVTATA
ncbi:unnamed protein product [Prorocentrum cordatum]|uniref:Uncharacterized protein n=1 Tax=Prorocentrum cordatum TaxID=2364126 RepID=A0ABN9WAZ5_9DINO|nr:unnamed protein product [Polarella glacialis]